MLAVEQQATTLATKVLEIEHKKSIVFFENWMSTHSTVGLIRSQQRGDFSLSLLHLAISLIAFISRRHLVESTLNLAYSHNVYQHLIHITPRKMVSNDLCETHRWCEDAARWGWLMRTKKHENYVTLRRGNEFIGAELLSDREKLHHCTWRWRWLYFLSPIQIVAGRQLRAEEPRKVFFRSLSVCWRIWWDCGTMK